MNQKIQDLFYECKYELNSIGIDLDNKAVGEISISIAKRACKRYGCCKQDNPIESTKYIEKVGRKKYIKYSMYGKHSIEISRWVMDLKPEIIKNTIIHEIIHCLPNCSNHGEDFKKYATYINYRLGYNISRVGDRASDLKASNVQPVIEKYNYKIECTSCGYNFLRKRLNCNFSKKYRCGKCGGKLQIYQGAFYNNY